PAATTSPSIGFSLTVSGMMIPPTLFSLASTRRITTRSCNGRNFMGCWLTWCQPDAGWSTCPVPRLHASGADYLALWSWECYAHGAAGVRIQAVGATLGWQAPVRIWRATWPRQEG